MLCTHKGQLGDTVVITTATSIHWPPYNDLPALSPRPSTKPSTRSISAGTALPHQQQLPPGSALPPVMKMMVKYFIICLQ